SPLKIEANPEFGENFAEYAGKGAEAVKKLLQEKRGQVSGAFYRPDLGAITLAWGEAGTGKSDGWGLSKIAKYHPEVLDKLEELIQTLPIVKETPNRYQLENATYKASIRKDFEKKPGNWVLTAFEKRESIAKRSTDLPSTQEGAKKTPLADTTDNNTTTPLKAQENLKVQELLQKAYGEWEAGKLPQDAGFQEAIQELLGGPVYKPQFNKDVKAFLDHSYGRSDLVFDVDKYRVSHFGDGMQAEMQGIAHIKEAIDNPNYVRQNKDGDLMFIKKVSPNRFVGVHLNMGLGRNGEHNKGGWGILSREGEDFKLGMDDYGAKTLNPTDKGYSQEELAQFKEERRLADIERAKEQKKENEKMAAKEAKANKPPIKKPKDYKQPQSLEGLEELPKITPKDPINQSFGKNYSRYANKGQEGLLALMYEKTLLDGQIANLYTRPELGGIDVWTQHYNMGVADSELKGNQLRYYHDNLKLGLETFKAQPQEFLTPVGREAQIRAKKDFKKWRNTHIANAIDRTIKEGDLSRKGNSVELKQ
ncbi:putative barnase/colicin E5 family endoribonuclease, partial [Helicobacter ailurogastricus]